MNSEALVRRARVHAALGDPARLAIVDALTLGDASPGELGQSMDLPSNLLAHHVKKLEHAGLISRTRSEGDHRRTYLRLVPGVLADVTPGSTRTAPRVVFVCTHNSARSQLAAALWTAASTVPAASAGTEPAQQVHPLAVAAARQYGLHLEHARTARVGDVLHSDDLVIAVCDSAHEQLTGPVSERLHWSVPDPAPSSDPAEFDRALLDLADRVDRLAPAVQPTGASR